MVPVPLDDIVDQFLARTGHPTKQQWDQSRNKKQCPECGGLHDLSATKCKVCGWGTSE